MPGLSPCSCAETATALVPEPGSVAHGTFKPYDEVVPYSKRQLVTVAPLGLTLAFRVAEVRVSALAALVSTLGGLGSAFSVWMLASAGLLSRVSASRRLRAFS